MRRWDFTSRLLSLHPMHRGLIVVTAVAAAWLIGFAAGAAAQSRQRPEQSGRGANNKTTETTEGTEDERPATSARRVPCDQIIAAVDHETGLLHGRSADMSSLAKGMHTTVIWVERCMLASGRRPRRPGMESAESREAGLENLEDAEPDEVAPEDATEPGARESKEHPEKERGSRAVKVPPTPADFQEYQADQ